MNQPSLGIVITTFGATPYVHLTLESLRRIGSGARVLVVDDSSGDCNIQDLCKSYGAEFATSTSRRGHVRGDLAGIIHGYRWAIDHNLDLLVKLSRRFIPVHDGFSELLSTFFASPFSTASAPCTAIGFPFRSEAFALKLDAWEQTRGVRFLEAFLTSGRTMYTEVMLYHVAAAIQNQSRSHDVSTETESFYRWLYLGTNRKIKNINYLWHEANTIQEYVDLAHELRLPYREEKFFRI